MKNACLWFISVLILPKNLFQNKCLKVTIQALYKFLAAGFAIMSVKREHYPFCISYCFLSSFIKTAEPNA